MSTVNSDVSAAFEAWLATWRKAMEEKLREEQAQVQNEQTPQAISEFLQAQVELVSLGCADENDTLDQAYGVAFEALTSAGYSVDDATHFLEQSDDAVDLLLAAVMGRVPLEELGAQMVLLAHAAESSGSSKSSEVLPAELDTMAGQYEYYRALIESNGGTFKTGPNERNIIAFRKDNGYDYSEDGRGFELGVYDDQFVMLWVDEAGTAHVETYTGNTEPMGAYANDTDESGGYAWGEDVNGDGVSELDRLPTGYYEYSVGTWPGQIDWNVVDTRALRPVSGVIPEFDVNHDGVQNEEDNALSAGWTKLEAGLFFHRGGESGTYSAGCQTFAAFEWERLWYDLTGAEGNIGYTLVNLGTSNQPLPPAIDSVSIRAPELPLSYFTGAAGGGGYPANFFTPMMSSLREFSAWREKERGRSLVSEVADCRAFRQWLKQMQGAGVEQLSPEELEATVQEFLVEELPTLDLSGLDLQDPEAALPAVLAQLDQKLGLGLADADGAIALPPSSPTPGAEPSSASAQPPSVARRPRR